MNLGEYILNSKPDLDKIIGYVLIDGLCSLMQDVATDIDDTELYDLVKSLQQKVTAKNKELIRKEIQP
jgi:hypothetical protein